VLQALAAGGGFTEFAHRDGVFVLRPCGLAAPTRVRFTWAALSRGEGHATGFRLSPGDVVVVE
jgi:polysaccharide export outer membrane protein